MTDILYAKTVDGNMVCLVQKDHDANLYWDEELKTHIMEFEGTNSKMTKLQEEMEEAVNSEFSDHLIAMKCAEVAKKWIEKAFVDGSDIGSVWALTKNGFTENVQEGEKNAWLKENGITE
jgi:hypothetical protein